MDVTETRSSACQTITNLKIEMVIKEGNAHEILSNFKKGGRGRGGLRDPFSAINSTDQKRVLPNDGPLCVKVQLENILKLQIDKMAKRPIVNLNFCIKID